jgi:hypothetical protein
MSLPQRSDRLDGSRTRAGEQPETANKLGAQLTRAYSPAAAAVARVRLGAGESHPPTPGLPASRSCSRRSGARRAGRPGRRKSDGVCSRVWPDRLDSDRSGGPRTPRGCNNCPRPLATNQSGRRARANPAAKVDQLPHARVLPIAQATPARHPRPAPEFLREHLPGNTAAKDEDNACEARAIGDARQPTSWPSRWSRQERFDKIPQWIWKQRGGHACSRYLTDEDQVSEVLLHALSTSSS